MRGCNLFASAGATVALAAFLTLVPATARAAITVINGSSSALLANGSSSGSQSFTVSSGADVLVVELSARNNSSFTLSNTNSLTYGGVPLIPAVDYTDSNNNGGSAPYRDAAIYYLFNPAASGTISYSNPNVTSFALDAFTLGGVDTSGTLPIVSAGGIGPYGAGPSSISMTLASSAAADVQAGAFAVLEQTTNSGGGPFSFSASNSGASVGSGGPLWTGTSSNSLIVASGGTISGLTAGTNRFLATMANPNSNYLASVAVFEPLVVSVSNYTWAGTINGNWSLASSDANWTGSGTAYSDSSNVTFADGAGTTGIAIAAGGVQPNSVLFTSNTASYSFSGGPISGPATVTLSGSGSVIFSNSNNYTGATTISAGTLQIGSGGSGASIGGTSNVVNNGTLVFYHSDPVLFAPVVSGSGGLVHGGGGQLVLSGSNLYTGATTVSGGTLDVTGSLSPSSTISVVSGATFGGSGIAGPTIIAAGGALTGGYSGSGGLTLASLTFSGSGTLNLTPAAGSYTGVNVTANGGLTVNGLNTVTVNIDNASPLGIATYTLASYAGTIGGTGSAGAFQLGTVPSTGGASRPRTYTITPAAHAIDLTVSGDSPIWTGANGSVWDTTTSNWVLASNHTTPTIFYTADTVLFDDTASNTAVTINGSDVMPASVTFSTTGSYTLSGTNAIAGSATLTKTGGGILAISNPNTYTSGTTVSGGTLQFGAANALPSSGTLNVNGASAVLDMGGLSPTIGALLLTNGTLQNGTLTAANFEVQNGSVSAILAGSGINLNKTTSGLVTLSASNAYTGTTTVSAGTLQIGSGTIDGSIAASSGVVNNAALVYNLLATQTVSTLISGSGSVTTSGPGGLTLANTANTYSGGTTVSQGTLQAAADGSLGNTSGGITLGNGATLGMNGFVTNRAIAVASGGSAAVNNTSGSNVWLEGPLSGGSLTIAGAGGTIITGSDSGLARLTVAGNSFANIQNLSFPASISVNSSANMIVAIYSPSSLNPLSSMTFASGSGLSNNGGTLNLNTASLVLPSSGTMSFNNVENGGAIAINGSTSVPLTGSLTISMGGSQPLIFNAATSGTGSLILGSAAPQITGTVILAGSNSQSGSTTLSAGMLELGSSGALLNSTLLVSNANGLAFTLGATATTLGGLSGSGSFALQDVGSNAVNLTVGNNGSSTTFTGVLSGAGGLVKSGTGSLTLTASNAYAGGTTVGGGILKLGNSAALGMGALGANGGTLDLAGYSATVSSFSGAAGVVTDNSTVAGTTPFTVNQSGSTTFGGSFQTGPNGRQVSLKQEGPGSLTLSGVNNVGSATVQNTGTLQITGTLSAGNVNINAGAQLAGLGTINVAGGGSLYFASSAAGNFGGAIVGPGAIEIDSGSLTLSGTNNSYAGGTAVVGGTLALAANNALPIVTAIAFGNPTDGTFDLAGYSQTVAGLSVAASDASNQVIGNSSTSSNSLLTFSSTGSSDFAGTIEDHLGGGTMTTALAVSGGTLVLSGSNSFTGGTTVSEGSLILGNNEALADGTSLTVGDASEFSGIAPSGAEHLSAQPSGEVSPVITAVPEPGTLALLAVGALAALAVLRRKSNR